MTPVADSRNFLMCYNMVGRVTDGHPVLIQR